MTVNTTSSYPGIPVVHQTTIVDNVVRYPPTGIKVVVVGAGPGGLMTALECWRKGHQVEVLEKAPVFSTIGKHTSCSWIGGP